MWRPRPPFCPTLRSSLLTCDSVWIVSRIFMKSGYLSSTKSRTSMSFWKSTLWQLYISPPPFLLLLLLLTLLPLAIHIRVGLDDLRTHTHIHTHIYIYIYTFLTGINSFSASIFHIYGPISMKFVYMISIQWSWVIVKFTKIGVTKVVPTWRS